MPYMMTCCRLIFFADEAEYGATPVVPDNR